jgi:multiple sugar transport system permease protein
MIKPFWGRIRTRTVVVHLVAWTIGLAWLVPFLGVFMTAVRPVSEIALGWWNFGRLNPSLDNFGKVLTHPTLSMTRGYANSFLIAIPATIIPVFVAALAGYGFSRFRFPFRDYLFLTIVLLMSVPQQMVAIPIFQLMVDLNLDDNLLSVILVHSAWGLPWIILFMRNFVRALPLEVEEAARVDGAGDFKIFTKIVLPMAVPALASAAVLQFMWVWNDFFFALILLTHPENFPVTRIIPDIGATGSLGTDWGLLSAASILAMLVPLVLYILTSRYYIRGMIGWTIKG